MSVFAQFKSPSRRLDMSALRGSSRVSVNEIIVKIKRGAFNAGPEHPQDLEEVKYELAGRETGNGAGEPGLGGSPKPS